MPWKCLTCGTNVGEGEDGCPQCGAEKPGKKSMALHRNRHDDDSDAPLNSKKDGEKNDDDDK